MNPSKDVLLILSFRPMGKFGSSLSSNAKITQLRYRVSICDAFRVLEPYAVKVASTVLRRERRGNPPDLSDPRFGLLIGI